jgi:hypothetical protein
MPADIAQTPDVDMLTAFMRRDAPGRPCARVRSGGSGNSPSDRRSIHVVLTPPGQEVFERAIAARVESIDHHLKTPPNDDYRAAPTVALIKIDGSDHSGDNRNRIHIDNVIAHSP